MGEFGSCPLLKRVSRNCSPNVTTPIRYLPNASALFFFPPFLFFSVSLPPLIPVFLPLSTNLTIATIAMTQPSTVFWAILLPALLITTLAPLWTTAPQEAPLAICPACPPCEPPPSPSTASPWFAGVTCSVITMILMWVSWNTGDVDEIRRENSELGK